MENRYEKYKDSGIAWIGEIPEHWDVCKLSTLFFQHKQKNSGSQEINLLSLSYGNIKRKDINTLEGLLPESFENYNIIDRDDIVFRLTDLQNDKKSLRSALCKERGIITSAYVTIRKRTNINPIFFNYLFRSYDECKVFYGLGDGVRQGMNFDDLRNLDVLLPQQDIQQYIATYLDQKCNEIDELIALQEEMITKLQSYKQSIITEAVTKGLDKNVPLKDSGIEWIGKIPEHWTLKRIKNICDNLDYLREPISAEHRSRNNPIYDYYGASGVIDKIDYYNVDDQVLLIGEDGANLVMRNLPLVYKAKGKFWVNNHAHILKPKDNNYDFCAYAFEAADYSLFITGSAQPKLSQENLGRIKIAIPPIHEQQTIADYLDQKCSEIDELISIKQQKIEKLKDYKKSLIFECVTGKRKV